MISSSYKKYVSLNPLNNTSNRTHNFVVTSWRRQKTEAICSQVNVIVTSFKHLSPSFSKLSKHTHTVHQVLSPKFRGTHVLLLVPLIVPAPSTRLYSQVRRNLSVLDFSPRSPVDLTSPKSKHLYNESCSFKPVSSNTMERNNNTSLIGRIKAFVGFGSTRSETPTNSSLIGTELKNFQSTLSKENLSPEVMQKLMLSFVEGYSFALERVIHRKSSWRPYYIFLFVGWLVYMLLKAPTSSLTLNVSMAKSTVKFDDVKGADEAKQELKNIVEFLKTPEKFLALGGKLPKGVLLVGLPGTGKTLLAKAVAGEAGVPFFCTSGSEFDEVFVGLGAKRIRELFRIAKENSPCVIFIDEIDSIGKQRTSSAVHPHANDSVNQLLTEMDGFKKNDGVIVLGATNRKKDLDKALLRPGRFDVTVTVQVPDYRGRRELFEFYLGKVPHQNVNIEKLARGTTNFTGADIENLVNQAAVRAAGSGADHVTMAHLEYARDKTLMGPESLSRVTDEDTNRITAYHEGGHALVAHYTEHAPPLHKVTIVARGESLGHTAYIPERDTHHVTRGQLLASLDITLAGRAAEEVVFGPDSVTSGASSDLEKATLLATKMVRTWGMSDAVGLVTYGDHIPTSPQTANLIDKEIKILLQKSYERAKSILIEHKDKHKELSETLLKEETLDASEVAAILKEQDD